MRGVINAPKNSKEALESAAKIVSEITSGLPVAKNYVMKRGQTPVDVYTGKVDGVEVAVYVATQDTDAHKAGELVTTITPSKAQMDSYKNAGKNE